MRPIKLQISAFGPFAGIEEIKFNELGKNPLFLINGPTGAGKSTILDAICFALYGETTGNEREGKEMRCDQAQPDILTEVVLEFELGSGVYRIQRIPDQFRPKARGEGFTEQKARAELYKLDGEQEILIAAPKVTEVTAEVVKLTGLSAEQFRQVMVLPQGKFRDLLLAKSEERELIFQQLFQTHIYSSLQNKLKEQSNALMARIKDIQVQQKALLESVELENSESLLVSIKSLSEELKKIALDCERVNKKLSDAQAILSIAKTLDKEFVALADITEKLSGLEAQQKEMEKNKQVLMLSKAAHEINPQYQDVVKQQLTEENLKEQLETCQKNLETQVEELNKLEIEFNQIPAKEKELEALNARVLVLDGFKKRAEKLRVSSAKLQECENGLEKLKEKFSGQQKQLEIAQTALQKEEKLVLDNTKSISELQVKKVALEKVEEQGKSLRRISDLKLKITSITDKLSLIKQSKEQAERAYNEKVRQRDIYEHAWQKAQASLLASTLTENDPCPVCGSKEHPNIASSEEVLPTENELELIRKEVESAKESLEKISREELLSENELKTLHQLKDEEFKKLPSESETSLEGIREQYKTIKNTIDSLQSLADELPAKEKQLVKSKEALKDVENNLESTRPLVLEKEKELAAWKGEVESVQSEFPEEFRDANSLDSALVETEKQRNIISQAIKDIKSRNQKTREEKAFAQASFDAATKSLAQAEVQKIEIKKLWADTLSKSCFNNEEEFLKAFMEKEIQDQTENLIRQYEDELLVTTKNQADKLTLVEGQQRPNLQNLLDEEQLIIAEKKTLDARFHESQQKHKTLIRIQEKLTSSLELQAKLESEYGVLGKLSDISNGKNPHNLSLQRFVLSVLLDDVLTEASYRLRRMSKGRYQLYRKESVGDKRTKSGLELEVEDAYTGKQRPAATLSGGESFMAALALALGLSDVVQSYAGGIRLETLFIDEGFGSLDPESLELAINTLIDLRASGRMIGIISHVEELKRIIDLRIDIIAEKGSSSTRLQTA